MLALKEALLAVEASYLPNWLPLWVLIWPIMFGGLGIVHLSTITTKEEWASRFWVSGWLIAFAATGVGIVLGWY